MLNQASSLSSTDDSKRSDSNLADHNSLLTLTPTGYKDIGVTASHHGQDDHHQQSLKRRRGARTGCLTCRERHLKCDETFPICENCQKSQRDCYRGLKLKFTYTNVKEPKILLVDRDNYSIKFMDESREIASNYLNCRESYIPYDKLIEDVSTRPPSTTCKGLFTKSLNPLQKAPFLSTDSGISINPKLQLKQPLLSNHFSVFLNKKTPPIRDVITS